MLSLKGGIDALKVKFDDTAWAKELPAPVLAAALKAANEKGHAGVLLAKAIQAAGGKVAANPADMAGQIAGMVKSVQMGSDPGAGELIYRRIGCVQCHSIGGAGGKLGPDLSSLGASAPLDYIVESVFDPAAKVKEGYHAFAYTMKDGTQVTGIPTRETATEQFIRPGPVPEVALVKANIVKKDLVGSLMPPGLADALDFTEKRSLFAFLSQIGRPGPFDASKGNILRSGCFILGHRSTQAEHADKIEEAPPVYTRSIDGRLPHEHIHHRDRADVPYCWQPGRRSPRSSKLATAGQDTLQPRRRQQRPGSMVSPSPSPQSRIPRRNCRHGVHTLAVQFEVNALPEILRVEAEGANFLGN